ncbi:MAG: hypothetical protein Q8O79_03630 [Pseudomonadota bacterium]|nr:hypothetical protein [Pseudomonadota bacterium]
MIDLASLHTPAGASTVPVSDAHATDERIALLRGVFNAAPIP